MRVSSKHVQPAEIENLLVKEPFVVESAVFGVPDPFHQEIVTAAVVLTDDCAMMNMEEILRRVNAGLEEHKQIKGGIFIVQDIPRNAHGKVMKKKLISQFADEQKVKEKDSINSSIPSTDNDVSMFSRNVPRGEIHLESTVFNLKGIQ